MRQTYSCATRSRQQGAVLYIALILLIILTIIGVVAARLQTGEAVMARNDHNHQLALQSAEAALRDAEINLAIGNWSIPQFAANPVARAGDPLCTPSNQTQSCAVYRVTAHAVGADASASATLQSIIH